MSETQLSHLEVGDPVPSNIADCADFFNEVKALRLALEARAKDIAAREAELKDHIIACLRRDGLEGVTGKDVNVTVTTKSKARLEKNGWDAFKAWVLRTGRTEFLYKRVLELPCKELVEAGAALPDGVEWFSTLDLSVKKAK